MSVTCMVSYEVTMCQMAQNFISWTLFFISSWIDNKIQGNEHCCKLTFCWGRMVKVATRTVRNVSTIICTRWCRSISIYIANISRGRKTKMKDWDYCQILTRKNDWRSVKPYIARLKGFTFSFLSMTAPSPTRRNMHAKILRACKLMIIGEEYEFRKKWYLHNIF